MANSVTRQPRPVPQQRKYLNPAERQRFLAAVAVAAVERRLLLETLAWTGARVSEVLAVCPLSFDLSASTVTLPTLKRRRPMLRSVPLPPHVIGAVVRAFDINGRLADDELALRPLWPMSRVTVWRMVKEIMREAGVTGVKASPRGLRHAFGVGTLQSGVPLHLLQRWFGHARLSTTAIYADIIGPDELAFARRFWASCAGPSASSPSLNA